MFCNDDGEIIITAKLSEFYPRKACWNDVYITNDMIGLAIENGIQEEATMFGDGGSISCADIEPRSDAWHIARIIYFINHPKEI